ncbi:MAG: serine hydrolase [Saprospiraceae bacterium]|nr:serine hydrolase [Saprospiraceae bacterium]
MKKILLLLFLPILLGAQQDQKSLLSQFFKGQHDYYHFNGNVLIAKGGVPIYQASFGYADFNTQRTLNENTVFELASVSKQFTALGILICRDRSLLDLVDDIKMFLPDFPYDGITIRHLLTHTSGLPAYEDQFEKFWDHHQIAYNKDVLTMLAAHRDTLFFEPGSQWRYSNTGYALLALIIEKVSGMRYNDFMSQNIFKPLGMNHTFVYNSRRSARVIPDNYALGYVYSDSLHRYTLPDSLAAYDEVYYLDGIVGDGCVNSTTGDLLIWDRALDSNTLVKSKSINEMMAPLVRITPGDSTTFYGFGVRVQPFTTVGKVVSHMGGWPGYATMLVRRSDMKETIIVLSNNQTSNGNIRAAIESILAGEELVMPYEHQSVTLPPGLIDRYAGKYFAFMTLEFIVENGKLFRTRPGTGNIELIPESETKFFYGDGTDRQIEFEVDTEGKVTKAWFLNTGQKGELKKIE